MFLCNIRQQFFFIDTESSCIHVFLKANCNSKFGRNNIKHPLLVLGRVSMPGGFWPTWPRLWVTAAPRWWTGGCGWWAARLGSVITNNYSRSFRHKNKSDHFTSQFAWAGQCPRAWCAQVEGGRGGGASWLWADQPGADARWHHVSCVMCHAVS